jgi:hypothetical protein
MIATQQKAAPGRGTGQAASNQQRPQPITAWPEHNPGETRSEREIATVLQLLDSLEKGALK